MHLENKYENREAKHDHDVQNQNSSDSFHTVTMIQAFWGESWFKSTGLIKIKSTGLEF